MLEQIWNPRKYFIYLKDDPGFPHPNVMRLPAGEYLCFQGRPKINEWDASYIRKIFQTVPESEWPTLVVADEYEENFNSFFSALYEIQILIWPSDGAEQRPFFSQPPSRKKEEPGAADRSF